ncbi:S-layer homology domain-containing protein [Paenibacillus sp. GXUN7292]|uniref:S-layer homology domain-containing protein n=1 Tax=Paenibacillus sp. GXUN7292 TaxID=3422499 RepID=UPI003D7E4F37
MSKRLRFKKSLIYVTLVTMLFSIFPFHSFAAEAELPLEEAIEESIDFPVDEAIEEDVSEAEDENATVEDTNSKASDFSSLMLLDDPLFRTMSLKFEDNLQDAELPLVSYTAFGQAAYAAGKYGNSLYMKQKKMKPAEPRVSLGNVEYGADQDFTIAFWFNADRAKNNVDSIVLSNKDYANWYRAGWVFTAHNRFTGQASGSGNIDLGFNFQTQGSPTAASNRIMEPFKGSMDGQWHHIAVSVTRGKTIETFMDGKSLNVLSLPALGQPNTTVDVGLPTHIGATGTGEQEKDSEFMMDDLNIIPRALTEAEIAELMKESVVESAFDQALLAMKFDENAVDQSKYAREVQLFNVPKYGVGRMGKSIRLGNYEDTAVKYADAGNITYGSKSFSMGFWLKINQAEDINNLASILGNTVDENTGWMFGVNADNELQWKIKGADSVQAQTIHAADADLGKWHHYTIIQDRSSAQSKIYVDGNQVHQGPLNVQGTVDPGTYSTKIGVDGNGVPGAGALDFLLDELYIFEGALSESDVETLYNMAPPIPEEEVSGELVFFGAEHSIADSLMRMNLTSRFKRQIDRASTLHTTIMYDPDKFEFIRAYAQDTRQTIQVLSNENGKLELKISGVIHKPSTHEFEYRESKMAILDFKTISESGEGRVAITEALFSDAAETVFFENAASFTLGEKIVQIHNKEALDLNKDGLITVSDIAAGLEANVSQDILGKIAEQSRIMPYKRVLFIGMDGGGNVVRGKDSPFWSSPNQQVQPVGDLLNIPFIRGLIESGAVSYDVRTVMPSTSTPNWVAMITGLDFEHHEVDNWSSAKNRYSSSSMYMDGHHAGTIHRTLNETWPQRRTAYFSVWFDAIYGHVEQNLGAELVRGLNNDDSYTLNNTLDFVRSGKLKDTSFIHVTFDETDTTGHSKGFYSREYYEKMNLTDTRIKQVVDEVARQGLLEDTLILMSADHGGGMPQQDGTIKNWTQHGYDNDLNRTVFMAANGRTVATEELGEKLLKGGNTYDIYAIVLRALGLEQDDTRDAKVPEGLFLEQTELNNSEAANVLFYTLPSAGNETVYKLAMNNIRPGTFVAEFELEATGGAFDDIAVEPEDGVEIIRFAEKADGKLQLIVAKNNGFADNEPILAVKHAAGKLAITQAMVVDQRGQESLPNLRQGEVPDPINVSFIKAPETAEKGDVIDVVIGLENLQAGVIGHEYILEYNADAFVLETVALDERISPDDAILRYNATAGKVHILITGNAKALDQSGALSVIQLKSLKDSANSIELLTLSGFVSDGVVKVPVQLFETEIELLESIDDKVAPAWPAVSLLSASNLTKTSLTLTWTRATDNVGVTQYKLTWEGGSKEVAGNVNKADLINLQPGKKYTFKVEAADAAGNWTTDGPSIEVAMMPASSGGGGVIIPPAEKPDPGKPGGGTDGETEEPEEPEEPSKVEETSFTDVKGHWATDAIKRAAELNIVKGYQDQTFRPNAAVTRAEFAVMLANAFKWNVAGEAIDFQDHGQISDWARKAIAQAIELGIVKGYSDDTFRPNQQISRTEMAVMLARAMDISLDDVSNNTGFADDGAVPIWAKSAVKALHQIGIIQGRSHNHFVPDGIATRAEVVTIIMRVIEQ